MILCICPNPSVDMFVWTDSVRAGETNRIRKEQRFPGGKGIHVAMAVNELGERAEVLGCWGGATGHWIREQCEQMGIRCHGPEVDGWSRTCMTFKSEGPWHDTELLGTGPAMDSHHFELFVERYRDILPQADLVCMSGSWPVGAPRNGYAQLVRIARDAGKFTVLDATGDQLRNALAERPGIVHMNRSEAESFFGGKDVVDNAKKLARTCEYAALTSGADGLYLVQGESVVHAQCAVDKVYSAVGSGDCLTAGLAVAVVRKLDVKSAASLGVACGAANCVREELGMLYRNDVELFLKKTEIN